MTTTLWQCARYVPLDSSARLNVTISYRKSKHRFQKPIIAAKLEKVLYHNLQFDMSSATLDGLSVSCQYRTDVVHMSMVLHKIMIIYNVVIKALELYTSAQKLNVNFLKKVWRNKYLITHA